MFGGFPGGSVVKNLLANAGDVGSIPESGRSPEEENGTHSSILAWKTPETQEPGRLQAMGLQRVGHDCAVELEKAMAPHSSTLGLVNPKDGGAWWAVVHGVSKSWTQLSDFTFMHWRRKW